METEHESAPLHPGRRARTRRSSPWVAIAAFAAAIGRVSAGDDASVGSAPSGGSGEERISASATVDEASARGLEDLTALSLEDLMDVEIATVRSASGYEQRLEQAPASVTVVTADEIRKHGHRTLTDILQSIPGLYLSYDRNYRYLGVRGFSQPGDYNSRVLLLIDGHRVNDNVYDQAPLGTEFVLDVDLIDRVEFVRGPSSSVYGSNAFFGVINVVTKRCRQIGSPEVSASVGSFGTYQGRASYGGHIGGGVDLVLSGSIYDSEGQTLRFDAFDDPATNNGFAQGLDGDRYYNAFTSLSYRDLTLAGLVSWREKDLPTAPYGTAFDVAGTHTVDSRWYADLKYEHDFDGAMAVTARAFYDGYYYKGNYVYELTPPPAVTYFSNVDGSRGDWAGTSAQITKDLGEAFKITAGAEYRYNLRQAQSNRDEDPAAVHLDDDRASHVAGTFLQGDVVVLPNLRLSAGVRYDYYSTFGSSVSPRAAVIFDPFASTTLKLLYGRAFRAPNAYELYYDDGGVTQKANPGLDPETIQTVELVGEQRLAEGVGLRLGAFYYSIDDLIAQVEDPGDGLLVFQNRNEVTSFGLEAGVDARLKCGLRGRLSYSFQHAEDREGDAWLANSPEHIGKLSFSFPLVGERLFAGLEVQYLSPRETVRGGRTRDVVLVNVTIFSQKLVDGLELSASVYNLLDWSYGDPVGLEIDSDEVTQDGISFRLKAAWRF